MAIVAESGRSHRRDERVGPIWWPIRGMRQQELRAESRGRAPVRVPRLRRRSAHSGFSRGDRRDDERKMCAERRIEMAKQAGRRSRRAVLNEPFVLNQVWSAWPGGDDGNAPPSPRSAVTARGMAEPPGTVSSCVAGLSI